MIIIVPTANKERPPSMHNLGQSSLESSISSTASLSVAGKASLRLEVSVLWGFAGKLAATPLYHMGHYLGDKWMC